MWYPVCLFLIWEQLPCNQEVPGLCQGRVWHVAPPPCKGELFLDFLLPLGKESRAVSNQLHIYCTDVSHLSCFSSLLCKNMLLHCFHWVSCFPCCHQVHSGTCRAALYTVCRVYGLCDSVCICDECQVQVGLMSRGCAIINVLPCAWWPHVLLFSLSGQDSLLRCCSPLCVRPLPVCCHHPHSSWTDAMSTERA